MSLLRKYYARLHENYKVRQAITSSKGVLLAI